MKDYIEIYKNALSSKICDFIINKFKNNIDKTRPGTVGNNQLRPELKSTLDLALTEPNVSSKKEIDFMFSNIIPVLEKSIKKYFSKYEIYNTEESFKATEEEIFSWDTETFLENVVWPKYTIHKSNLHTKRYLPQKDYFNWHVDREQGSWPTFCRELVMMFYLNDVSEGGETEFMHQNKLVKPSKGTLVIFPAGFTGKHRGLVPKSGEKYILNFWLCSICPPLIEEIYKNKELYHPVL